MARSLLGSFVSGARQVLLAQLIISVAAVGLAGWTLGVTNELIRERDRLRERVIQLEGEMGSRGIVVPPTVVVDEPVEEQTAYPGQVDLSEPEPTPGDNADGAAAPEAPASAPESPQSVEEGQQAQPPQGAQEFDPRQIFAQLFAPPPPVRTLVLHARNERDAQIARQLGEDLSRTANVRVVISVMPPRDPRQTGYAYYDGRQGRAAAAIVSSFNDLARQREVAAWSAQLRGVALPAAGDYTADRVDIVLPPLPELNLQLQRVDPRVLQRAEPEPQPSPIR